MVKKLRNFNLVTPLVAILFLAFALITTSSATAREIKLAHLAPTNDPRHESLTEFAKMIEQKTGGALKVKIYPSSTLGKDREVFEQLQSGVTELALHGGVATNFYKKWSIINMPYMWRDQAAVREFLSSPVVKKWIDDMASKTGVRLLAFYDRNPRILTTKPRPIKSVDDLKGLKVRVPRIDTYLDTWKAFGVQPVPMPASEFYMALKLGTIDGMENPIEVMYHWKIYEVSKYLSLTQHMREVLFLATSQKFYNSLSDAERSAIQEAATESAKSHTLKTEKAANELAGKLKEKGMEIVTPDLAGFKKQSLQVHEKYMKEFGKDVYEMVKAKYSN